MRLAEATASPLAPARETNKMRQGDGAVHDWYRFVLSFPPHLVRERAAQLSSGDTATVLDPFCGTGTTLVECKKLGVRSVGIEAHPMAAFASRVKVDWSIRGERLEAHANVVAERAGEILGRQGLGDGGDLPLLCAPEAVLAPPLCALPPEAEQILLANSISALPLHRILVLLEVLRAEADPVLAGAERLALAKIAVAGASNLSFGPEVGLGRIRRDAPVIALWLKAVQAMAADLRALPGTAAPASVIQADARQAPRTLDPESIDAVITSPPYPNEKDYTRTTRLESVLLGFLHNRQDLRGLKQGLVRSNTRGVYVEDRDDRLVDCPCGI